MEYQMLKTFSISISVSATGIWLLILWFIFLFTANNNYYSPTYERSKKSQYHRIMESELVDSFKLHNDTLANLANFEFIMNNVSLCAVPTSEDPHSDLVVMIHTARYNFDRRYAIRNTWGSIKEYKQWRLHLIFLLGTDSTSDPLSYTEIVLWNESEEFGDMIMGNFVDSYRNLTYKHLMGYKWVSTFCPSAKYILKTDDDMYADIFQVIDVVLMELANSDKSFACENMGGNCPDRANNSKWYVPKEEFEDDIYPDYCSGSAYLVRADDASKIYSISSKTNFLWVDDAFVTGVLRDLYHKIVYSGRDDTGRSLNILTLYNRHHLGDKKEITSWCSMDMSTSQLNYAFILLEKDEFIRDMFCIWNKVRLMRFAMNAGSGVEIDVENIKN